MALVGDARLSEVLVVPITVGALGLDEVTVGSEVLVSSTGSVVVVPEVSGEAVTDVVVDKVKIVGVLVSTDDLLDEARVDFDELET